MVRRQPRISERRHIFRLQLVVQLDHAACCGADKFSVAAVDVDAGELAVLYDRLEPRSSTTSVRQAYRNAHHPQTDTPYRAHKSQAGAESPYPQPLHY